MKSLESANVPLVFTVTNATNAKLERTDTTRLSDADLANVTKPVRRTVIRHVTLSLVSAPVRITSVGDSAPNVELDSLASRHVGNAFVMKLA